MVCLQTAGQLFLVFHGSPSAVQAPLLADPTTAEGIVESNRGWGYDSDGLTKKATGNKFLLNCTIVSG